MLQATEWLKRKAFALHPLGTSLAFKREHMAGLFPGTLSSGSLTCPVRLVWTSSAWGRAGLAEPLARARLLPFPLGLWFIQQILQPRDRASLGNEGHPHGWKCVCSSQEAGLRGIGIIQVIFLVCNPLPQPGPALEEQRRLLTSGTEAPAVSAPWVHSHFLSFQQPRWSVKWQ